MINPKTASLPELRDYWRRQRQIADDKLRHIAALMDDEPDTAGTPSVGPVAGPTRNTASPQHSTKEPTSLKRRAIDLLTGLLAAETGPFTQRDLTEYLAKNGLSVTKQVMSHTVKTMLDQGLLVSQPPPEGSLAKFAYGKGPRA